MQRAFIAKCLHRGDPARGKRLVQRIRPQSVGYENDYRHLLVASFVQVAAIFSPLRHALHTLAYARIVS
jgi:hypothetical protein